MHRWGRILGLVVFVVLGAHFGSADTSPPPFQDFQAKRVGVPLKSAPRRLVQIDPAVQPFALTPQGWVRRSEPTPPQVKDVQPEVAEVPKGLTTQHSAWFWDVVSPSINDADPGRLETSLVALTQAPDRRSLSAPTTEALRAIASDHGPTILSATAGTQVSPALVLAVIWTESAGRPSAVSSAGAGGLMQLMPATAERFGVQKRMAPEENIRGGAAYLDWLLSHFNGDPLLALAGYNAGEGAVGSHGGIPPYAETRAYVPKVLAAWSVARLLCRTPPKRFTDACLLEIGPDRVASNG